MLGVVALAMNPNTASAALFGVLDQEHLVPGSLGVTTSGASLGQTFLVGVSGRFVGLEIPVFAPTSGASRAQVAILGTDRGVPVTTDVLASATIDLPSAVSFSSIPLMIEVDLSGAGLMVNDGDLLAIAVSGFPCCGSVAWRGGSRQLNTADYIPGAGFDLSGVSPTELSAQFGIDFEFRTWVQPVPEPSVAVFLGLGFAVLSWRGWWTS